MAVDVRAIGLDLGSKRIGVATSDTSGLIATPYTVLQRTGDRARDHRAIAEIIRECEATVVVVGLPLSLSGESGPAARGVIEEIEQMSSVVGVPIETYDERMTSVVANEMLMERKMKAQARRRVVDKVAAAVMLQAWLDHRRNLAGS
ncbi:MAG: Holliday junction resolvase RuvX [Actinomycetota bacterium]